MQVTQIAVLNTQVLWAAFLLSVLFGALANRTHFCTMGAVSDIVNMSDWTRLRQWGLAMGVAVVGFGTMAYLGVIDPSKVLYHSNRWIWLSAGVGGLMFGFGMVLASGCGSKTLVRVGSGSLKSLIVLIVMGASAFATMKGVSAVVRVATVDRVGVDFATAASLPHWLAATIGLPVTVAGLGLAWALGGTLMAWALVGAGFRTRDNLQAGVGIGGIVLAMWWVSGNLGHVLEHPLTLEETFLASNSGRAEALSFVAPVAYTLDWILFFSDRGKVLSIGVVSVLGVIVGSWVYSVGSRTFRWEGFGGTEDVANHLVGALLMGVGGVTAMGCTIGQGLSGISTLSANSVVAVAAIVVGAVAALRYQAWRLDRMA